MLMKKIFIKFFFLLFLLVVVSCRFEYKNVTTGQGKVQSVSVVEFVQTVADNSVKLVDVRTAEEFAAGNIPGSINIDVNSGHFGDDISSQLSSDTVVAIYCRSGNRSKKAAKMLSLMGYDVVELDKGYKAWCEYNKSK